MKKQALPDWVVLHKEPKTEIKLINGIYYKYSISYKYNSAKKRTDKITGALLGKITETGFVESQKQQIIKNLTHPQIDILNYGVFNIFSSLLIDEYISFQKFFPQNVSEVIFSFSMFRWAYHSPIKRAHHYYKHDYCSNVYSVKSVSDKSVSNALKFVGENRTQVVEWMKSLLPDAEIGKEEFVMMDSTHITSNSELLTVNAKGYNPDFNFEKQIRLLYLFSSELQKPVYYRLVNGNITDVKSMVISVEEMKIAHVVYIADKGFYSKDNIRMLQENNMQYLMPLQRNNALIDYSPLLNANFKKTNSYFIYQKRIIWYFAYETENNNYITFLDDELKVKEEADYIKRMESHPEDYTFEKFQNKLHKFGTLTLTFSINSEKSAQDIYKAYKQRNEIEIVFDSYKNFLGADVMYMQNRYVMEGWLVANFIAMLAYHKLFVRLRDAQKLKAVSPADIIELSKAIYMLKINDEWKVSEITQKTIELFAKIKIDYLKVVQS
jgi:transposase